MGWKGPRGASSLTRGSRQAQRSASLPRPALRCAEPACLNEGSRAGCGKGGRGSRLHWDEPRPLRTEIVGAARKHGSRAGRSPALSRWICGKSSQMSMIPECNKIP